MRDRLIYFFITFASLASYAVLAGIGLLIWALVKFSHGDRVGCDNREVHDGFLGNPDFYGLGI